MPCRRCDPSRDPPKSPPVARPRDRVPRAVVAALCAACLWAAAWGTLAAWQVLLTHPAPPDTQAHIDKMEARVKVLELREAARSRP